MGMTIAEKILAAHAGKDSVKPGQYIWCKVDATSGHQLKALEDLGVDRVWDCLLYTSPSPRDKRQSRMPSSA